MRQLLTLAMLAILVLSSYPLTVVGASSTPQQYQSNITVDDISVIGPSGAPLGSSPILLSIDSVPALLAETNAWPAGTVLEIVFHAVYLTGEPVTLKPQTASFGFSNNLGMFKKLVNATIVSEPRGQGWYSYNFTVTSDFPTGRVSVGVLAGSLRDSSEKYGPTEDVNSEITAIPTDNSAIEIGTPTPSQPSQPSQPSYASYDVPLLIAALVVIALLLLVIRGRKKRK